MQLNSVRKPPTEFNQAHSTTFVGLFSKSVSCQHATGQILPTTTWHVRYTRDTS